MPQNTTSANRPRLAAVITAYKRLLHGQHVVDRFLDGYGWAGTFHHPAMDVVSLYVDQRGEGDLTQERVDRHPTMKLYPTIAETLTLGTSKLAVDGVVVVGEHGTYPLTETGIMKHPHFEFFEQITKVFHDSGRSVPYFNDKELSYRWDWSKQMVDTSQQMGFPLQGGSSLAVTWRVPSVEFPLGATVHEAVSVGYGGMGSYDFHGLETIQCMVERRKGGETGVEWLQTYRGDGFWTAWQQGVWSQALVKAALVPQFHPGAGDCHLHRYVSHGRADAGPGARSGCLPLPTSRRPALHHAADERAGARLHLRGGDRGAGETLFHADVFAYAGRPHHAGKFFQPAGLQRRADVPHRQGAVSDRTDAADQRPADRRRR